MATLSIKIGAIADEKGDSVAIPLFEESAKTVVTRIDRKLTTVFDSLKAGGDFEGKAGQVCVQSFDGTHAAKRVVFVGLGSKDQFSVDSLRQLGAHLVDRLGSVAKTLLIQGDSLPLTEKNAADYAQGLAEGLGLAAYSFDRFKSEPKKASLKKAVLVSSKEKLAKELRAGAKAGDAIVAGVGTARDLGNLPGNHGQPAVIAKEAQTMAKSAGLSATVLGPTEMKRKKMGALLSVSLGSPHEPRLIVLEHNKGKKNLPTICLVGKGLTFDSGGISIKPSADMDKMRYDKCGGCVVIGAMHAIAKLNLPLHVVGIVPASENMPGGDANKPGDVVTASNGKTIEILNTDAEGRLILADALVHAQTFKPDTIIDLATLTGACMIALGQHACGLMTTDDSLARDLVRAGETSSERAWRLPLWDEYVKEMEGATTDLKNLGSRFGGAITAGAFLKSFVGEHSWAHLDIAGVSWDDPLRPYNKGKGATGFGVRLLVQYLRNLAD